MDEPIRPLTEAEIKAQAAPFTTPPVDAAKHPDASATVTKTGIETHPVASTQIKQLSFNHDTKIVTVAFNNGTAYEYQNVDYERFSAIVKADSVGRAFNALVKGDSKTFPYTKVL